MSTDSQSAAHIFEVAVPPSRLNPRDVELIAARVAEILSDTESWPGPARFADAATIAEKLGVDRNWVYAHARELGAVRLGGSRGRLRFDLEQVERALVCREQPPPKRGRPRRLRRGAAQVFGVELLPVRGIQSLDTANSGRGARQRPRPDTGR